MADRLIFETPSKSCGAKVMNGTEVVIIGVYPVMKKVKRCGGFVNAYLVGAKTTPPFEGWWAYPDEIHIERSA